MIKAYKFKTNELIGEYATMREVAKDFDVTLETVKSYFYRYKKGNLTKIKNYTINEWCYLEQIKLKNMPSYKERCDKAIEMLDKLNIQLKDVLKTGINIKEISDIKETLKGDSNE